MKQQNFVTAALTQPVQPQSYTVQQKRVSLFDAISNLYTRYVEWSARRDRVRICRQVAQAFRTDMESAGVLLFLFRDQRMWIDGDPYIERERLFAYMASETEQPQIEQHEAPVHPAWPEEKLKQLAPMIEDYGEAFMPEARNVTKLAQTLSLQQVERPKFAQPKAKPAPRDVDLDLALDALIDYTQAAFDEGLTDSEGVLLKGNVAPWAKRGDLPAGPKAKAKMIINGTNPAVWFFNNSKLWQFNLREYANPQSAKISIQEAYQAIINGVGVVGVGNDEDA